jgi:hypothetical protein
MQLSTADAPLFREPDEQYFASGAFGSSHAKAALESPAKLRDLRDGVHRVPDSPAFRMGRMWEAYLCSGGDDSLILVRPPDLDGRTKAGKEWKAEAESSGRPIATQEEMGALRRMLERMTPHQRELGELPAQLVGRIDAGGWFAQCKLDLFDEMAGAVIDIKTTSAPLEKWTASAWWYDYHVQAGWYRWVMSEAGMDRMPFGFLVSETICPWHSAVFWASSDFLAAGDERAAAAAGIISGCSASGIWGRGFPPETMVSPPAGAGRG